MFTILTRIGESISARCRTALPGHLVVPQGSNYTQIATSTVDPNSHEFGYRVGILHEFGHRATIEAVMSRGF
jgi:hypothetical protein